ncbi:membrane-spanning 4-domains subfamily A member 6A isoform X1 [Perognathus longimembris pacificus]|uniref:membrane-spanning 4-domains subfamily A member 6A isoform X1 n=1 Tax=Perognathus longimembris pacificus TaxID=214514 RepID=UPI0020197B19|nr:membrane-spanning 4-domains subfamily A member 6A isoform X1 [Perognathus longimembris pacificus]
MIPQVVTRETVTVIRSNGTIFDQPQPTHQMDYSLKKYILDEIKVIGAIQILCAIMVLIFGILLACAPFSPDFTPVFSSLIKSGYPFVGPVCFIICGSLSIITDKKSTKPWVHSSLALSIVSTLFGLLGFILLSLNLSVMDPAVHKCELTIPPTESSYHYYHWSRYNECYMTKISLAGVLGLMLVCTLVELGLAVLSVVLWWIQSNSDFPGRVHFVSQTSYDKLNFSNQEISQNTYEELLKN